MYKLFYGVALVVLASCSSSKKSGNETAGSGAAPNTLTKAEKSAGWKLLFDGKTKTGWHVYNKKSDGSAWKVVDGTLHFDPSVKTGAGDIVSDGEFENFHLKLDWKLEAGGNSGIMFLAQEDPKYKYAYYTGPEMQMIDNTSHPDAKNIKHRSGDLYDMISAKPEASLPATEWSTIEIISNNSKLELKVNGATVVSTTMWDENWRDMISRSKFKTLNDFGTFRKGRFDLQDHGNKVWFRNIKIRQL
ncbi:3-keto-disaccharide hydrolase [Flavitalea antarctica]